MRHRGASLLYLGFSDFFRATIFAATVLLLLPDPRAGLSS